MRGSWIICALLSLSATTLAIPQSNLVKKSVSGICHDATSPSYAIAKHYQSFESLDDCLKSGGRLPKDALHRPQHQGIYRSVRVFLVGLTVLIFAVLGINAAAKRYRRLRQIPHNQDDHGLPGRYRRRERWLEKIGYYKRRKKSDRTIN
jgi:hypothetical protein